MMSASILAIPKRDATPDVSGVTNRGRPASVDPANLDEALVEVRAIRAEMREMADEVIPLAAHLWRNALIDGDPKAKAAAGRIVYLGKRLAERGGPDKAA